MEKLEGDLRSKSAEIGRLADEYAKYMPNDARGEEVNVLRCMRKAALELHNASIWVQRNQDIEEGKRG